MIHNAEIIQTQPRKQTDAPSGALWLCGILTLYMIVVGLYFVARFGGRWAETDSAAFTDIIRNFVQEGRLIPQSGESYANGYAYQIISAYLLAFTGLDVTTLQQIVYPILTAFIVIPSWLMFRELTGSVRGATIGTALLLVQPEFLFVILRSSHEKFTRLFLILCVYLLVRTFKFIERPWLLAAHVILFYMSAYALITCNSFLGNSFIAAVAAALLLGWGLNARLPYVRMQNAHLVQRLAYVSLTCLGLAFLFSFYLYPPARETLRILQSLSQRIAALFLDVQAKPTNSYTQVVGGWVNLPVYFMVSIANWLTLVVSGIIWVAQGWLWVVRRKMPPSQSVWLLFLLYTAFAIQGISAIIADTAGGLGNLQHRLFPSISIIAVALIAAVLAYWQPQRWRTPLVWSAAIGLAVLSLMSVVKAVNEPLISNTWTFYRPYELTAVQWADAHLVNEDIWTDYNERIYTAYVMEGNVTRHNNSLRFDIVPPTTRNILMTDVTRIRSLRVQRAIPLPADVLRVYDNGKAQMYHLRPQTQYQH